MLGNSLRANSIGLGCMGITHAFGTPLSKKVGMKVISETYDMGYDFFDMAECYTGIYPEGSPTNNEKIVVKLYEVSDIICLYTIICVFIMGRLIMDSHPSVIRSSMEVSLSRIGAPSNGRFNRRRQDLLLGYLRS